MERNAFSWWPLAELPSPLSTDIEEVADYMRVAHAVGAARRKPREGSQWLR